ncbi:baseplate J/gp47 family protein [Pseudomonas helmanticensis]|uniref:baseplate J/gp47 family protein n=1 Tax=Pseudomonas helmanticensis TaxID=1471381 RepID=UPI0038114A3B
MFQIKDFVSITASMLNWMRASTHRITDYNVGSVARTLVEAPAAEIDELYQQMFIGIKEAIPVATYATFNFDALPQISAAGPIRVQVTPGAGELIAAGTTFSGTGLATTYSALADVVIEPGASFVDVTVAADNGGVIGNIPKNQAFTLTPSPGNFVSASNLSAFSSGTDAETPDERKLRFASYINSIARSTVAAITYGLTTANRKDKAGNIIEHVASAAVVEPYLLDPNEPIALVNCYVHNGTGSTSAALVAIAQKIIDGDYDINGNPVPGYKAAGIPAHVYAATELLVDVEGNLSVQSGYDEPTLVKAAISAINSYLLGLGIGEDVLSAEIIRIVKSLDGVYDFALTSPDANIAASKSQKIMPGALNIT